MLLPSNDELREMLGYASAYPWQHRAGAIHPNNDDATWVVAIVDDEDGQVCLDDDIDLMLLAPQLAEEVIRLREEIAGVRLFCRDGMEVYEAEARLTDHEEEKAWREGRRAAYCDIYRQITQGHRRENKEGDDK